MSMKYFFVAGTVIFAALGQMVLKLGASSLSYPTEWSLESFAKAFVSNFFNIYIVISVAFAFCSAGFWVLVVQKIPLNKAYPFMSLNYVLVYFLSWIFFKESLSFISLVGLSFVFFGLYLLQR